MLTALHHACGASSRLLHSTHDAQCCQEDRHEARLCNFSEVCPPSVARRPRSFDLTMSPACSLSHLRRLFRRCRPLEWLWASIQLSYQWRSLWLLSILLKKVMVHMMLDGPRRFLESWALLLLCPFFVFSDCLQHLVTVIATYVPFMSMLLSSWICNYTPALFFYG